MSVRVNVFTRLDTKGKKRFYARFLDEEGAVVRTIAVKDDSGNPPKNRNVALSIARKQAEGGVVADSENPVVVDYIIQFWKRDSGYVRGRALRGVQISDHYLYDMSRTFTKEIAPLLGKRKILNLDARLIEEIILELSKSKGARTVNVALQSLKVPVAYYCRTHKLANPLLVVQKVMERPKDRGVLTLEEITRLVKLEGVSPRIRVAVLLGCLCGLRMGECRGLQFGDVDEARGMLVIRNNWATDTEGLKGPKHDPQRVREPRIVPAPDVAIEAIRNCRDVMPSGLESPFVIWNEDRGDRPMTYKPIAGGFQAMLKRVGIDADQRNLVFHSLRHTFVSLSRSAGLPDFVVQRLAGHRSAVMMERYSHASVLDFAHVRAVLQSSLTEDQGLLVNQWYQSIQPHLS